MSSKQNEFDLVCKKIKLLTSYLEKTGIQTQTEFQKDSTRIIIHTTPISNNSALTNAKTAVNDILELSYSSAEHHPYWSILYNTCEILTIILEKWDGIISDIELQDLEWLTNEIKYTLQKLKH